MEVVEAQPEDELLPPGSHRTTPWICSARLFLVWATAIIFIDELDAIGTKRFDSDKSGGREVQRTMLELLNQLDRFGSDDRIKVGPCPETC